MLSILAACGGSGKHAGPARIVSGPGFTYTAPAGWKVRHTPRSAASAKDGAFVLVTVFSLRKPYMPSLFTRAAGELDRVAAKLVADSQGTLTDRVTTTIVGRRARAYRYSTAATNARIAFVLAGRHEYELLCRNPKGGADLDGACALLFSTFAIS